jgi:LiaI-LiaF-like transmembrane region
VNSRVDGVTLGAGLFFIVAGVLFLLDELSIFAVTGRYLLPLGLILAGIALLAGALLARR